MLKNKYNATTEIILYATSHQTETHLDGLNVTFLKQFIKGCKENCTMYYVHEAYIHKNVKKPISKRSLYSSISRTIQKNSYIVFENQESQQPSYHVQLLKVWLILFQVSASYEPKQNKKKKSHSSKFEKYNLDQIGREPT